MVRASQGLQVLLIVFVMLTVVLGVTTYLYNKQADEATKAALAANSAKQQAEEATAGKQKECDVLKTLIGYPERSTEEIQKQSDEDMKTYGSERNEADKAAADKPLFDPNNLHYSRLLASMNKVMQDRTDELIRARAQYAEMDMKFKNREAVNDDKFKAYTANYDTLNGQIKDIANDFSSKQQATVAEGQQLTSRVAQIKRDAAQVQSDATAAATAAKKAVQDKDAELAAVLRERNKVERKEMDVPSGEITWVSLPNKLVWINRGRADDLQRQTKFTVYSADSSNLATAVKKGTVEVVRIEGDHMAQARILDDKLADPIMAGDKVFTPLWSPGQQNHFALAGIMNLDGDGRNQLSIVRGLINQNGGAVDCELDEQGHKQGQITASTRIIVVGDAPDKSSQEFMKNNGDILRDAERYHLQILKLSDFKQQMGYQKTSSVEHFGSSATSTDVSRAASAVRTGKPAPKAAGTTTDDNGK